MSLFVVQRYLGDEEEELVSEASRSRALLTRLQQKAKDKRRLQHVTTNDQDQEEPRRHRRRKAEDEEEDKKSSRRRKVEDEEEDKRSSRRRKVEDEEEDKRSSRRRKVEDEEEDKRSSREGGDVQQMEQNHSDHCVSDGGAGGGGGGGAGGGGGGGGDEACRGTEDSEKTDTGFTVLGGFQSKPVQKVSRVLPRWLAEPDVIHRDIRSHLVPVGDIVGLSPPLQKVLKRNQVQHLFPVQAEVIPAILEGAQQGVLMGPGGSRPRDICVSAPTGSGKTLSFVLPVVEVLMQRVVCEVRALAVLPTKELAQQVYKVFTSYTEGTSLRVALVSGQKSFTAEQATLTEDRGAVRRSAVDIVVATPGRLVDHINKNPNFCLQHLRFLIIDEADRMIDSMHQSWLGQVEKAVYGPGTGAGFRPGAMFRRTEPGHITAASLAPPPMPLQKLLFSATLTQNPEKLQQLSLHQPRLFSSSAGDAQRRYDFPQGLTEYYVPCTLSKKPLIILHFLLRLKLHPILCFTNSRETAHRLFLLVRLFGGIRVAEFSSRLAPADRKRALKDFEQGATQLLISTDAAARGIDVTGVKCVVNYDAPQYVRSYIHRIGRTARAGKAGLAFTFLLRVQEKSFLQMVEEAGSAGIQKQLIKATSLQSMEQRYEQTLQQLADVVQDERGTR